MRTRSWAACLGVAILAALAPSASALTDTDSVPFTATMSSECTGDSFVAQGRAHFKFTASPTVAGGIKYQFEINTTGVTGRTLAGIQYVANDQTSEMNHSDSDDAQFTSEQTILMTRQGETAGLTTGDDLRFKFLVHLTVTNGTPTASQFEFRSECR
jgi:hypothetical protein